MFTSDNTTLFVALSQLPIEVYTTGKWLPVVHTTPCCCALYSFQHQCSGKLTVDIMKSQTPLIGRILNQTRTTILNYLDYCGSSHGSRLYYMR